MSWQSSYLDMFKIMAWLDNWDKSSSKKIFFSRFLFWAPGVFVKWVLKTQLARSQVTWLGQTAPQHWKQARDGSCKPTLTMNSISSSVTFLVLCCWCWLTSQCKKKLIMSGALLTSDWSQQSTRHIQLLDYCNQCGLPRYSWEKLICIQCSPKLKEFYELISFKQDISNHEYIMTWKCFLLYWPCVRGIHLLLVHSLHKGPVM